LVVRWPAAAAAGADGKRPPRRSAPAKLNKQWDDCVREKTKEGE